MSEDRAVEAAIARMERFAAAEIGNVPDAAALQTIINAARAYLALSGAAPNPAVERPADIVERLRKWGDGLPAGILLMREAAAEIERLRAVERPADPRGWHEAIEAAAKVCDDFARTGAFNIASVTADVLAKRIRSLSPAPKDREGG